MITFQYSIIKYMPDPRRGEVVNVGLVVFTDAKVDVRTLSNVAKARMIDGVTSATELDLIKEGFEKITAITNSPAEAISLLSTFKGSSTYISEPAYFVLDDINQYEKRVRNLFDQLVRPFASKERVPRNSRIHTYLKSKFSSLELLGKDSDDLSRHKVVYNYLISDKTGFTADFLLKNGRYHITEAIDFNVNDTNTKFKETTMKVMTFMEGRKALGEDSARYFVYAATAAKEKEVISHINLAEDYSDKIFNIESKEEAANYFQLISSLAGAGSLSFH